MHSNLTTIALVGLALSPLGCADAGALQAALTSSTVRNDAFATAFTVTARDPQACAALDDLAITLDGEAMVVAIAADADDADDDDGDDGTTTCPTVTATTTLPAVAAARDGELVVSGGFDATIVIGDLVQARAATIENTTVTGGEALDIDFVPAVWTPPSVVLRDDDDDDGAGEVETVLDAELGDDGARASANIPAGIPPGDIAVVVSGTPAPLAATTCRGLLSCAATSVEMTVEAVLTIVDDGDVRSAPRRR
ncbi:MAG TPA: hypothetical protein VGF99_16055 [Myxococcota bacterium]